MKLSQLEDFFKRIDSKNTNQRVFKILLTIVVILILFIIANLLFPSVMSVVMNIIWILLLTIVVVFIFLGVLVIVGLRKEAGKILDILFEGSLTLVDFVEFVRHVYKRFIDLLKEFLLYAAPILAYLINALIYIVLLLLYKFVGRTYDVTVLTFIITIVLIITVAFLNTPTQKAEGQSPWSLVFKQKYKEAFSDAMEVLVFAFFLTMDSTTLFFIPQSLNVPLHAQIGSYDLMIKGFVYNDHLKITLNLIIITTVIEIIRNVIRIVFSAKENYMKDSGLEVLTRASLSEKLKTAIRKSFNESKDEFVKFITYTTFLLFVFLLFPRLKLLTLAIASVTSLVLDILMPSRVKPEKREDLIARVLVKVFRL